MERSIGLIREKREGSSEKHLETNNDLPSRPAPQTVGHSDDVTGGRGREGVVDRSDSTNHEFIYD